MNEEQVTEALSTVTDAVTDLISNGMPSLPPPIRRNVFKVFGQLCSAVMDVPVAYLEGVAAEYRAVTQARVNLITASSDQIAAQMNVDPQYAQKAADKYARRIIKEQINTDKICEVAAQEISSTMSQDESSEEGDGENVLPISDDWINAFRKEACGKSSEEMQILFGKILAGEIKQPGSFSLRTVMIMGQLDIKTAHLFRRLCSLCVTLENKERIFDARVLSLNGDANANALLEYDLSYWNLTLLEEYGLIISDLNSWVNYAVSIMCGGKVGALLKYNNAYWALDPMGDNWNLGGEFRIHGVKLSNSGAELLRIVDIEPNEQYTSALNNYFLSRGLKLIPVSL